MDRPTVTAASGAGTEHDSPAHLAGMRRLYDVYAHLATENDLKAALDEILAAACEFTNTDRGCVQLVTEDGRRLEIFTHRGYDDATSPFINHFRHDGFAHGGNVARVERRRLLIEDVVGFPGLEGTPGGAALLADGIRAAQSTPMISRSGETVGVLSTQFARPHRPSDEELRLVDFLAWTAADFVERQRAKVERAAAQRALRDAKTQVRAAVAQHEMDRQFQALVNATSQVLYRMNPDWTEMRQLGSTGFLADMAAPSTSWLEKYVPPEAQPDVRAAIARAVRTKSVFESEHPVLRQDGTVGCMLSFAVPLFDANGNVTEWFGAATDVTERRRSEEELRRALAERDELLKELHHRVKNNLQVVTSLLEMQGRQAGDPQAASLLSDAKDRISAIAAIHELLYQSGSFSEVDLSAYARGLVRHVVSLYDQDGRIAASVTGEDIRIDLARAVPCGLLLNELVSNACKHAFPAGAAGAVEVTLRKHEGCVQLQVTDNGVGLPTAFSERISGTLGVQLVRMLAKQLGGTITFTSSGGTAVDVRVPLR